jgi:hypothetical protein
MNECVPGTGTGTADTQGEIKLPMSIITGI